MAVGGCSCQSNKFGRAVSYGYGANGLLVSSDVNVDGEEMTRDAGVEEELRFTDFSVGTNAVHFAASVPPGIELPEGKIDLYADLGKRRQRARLFGAVAVSFGKRT